ncbi:MAG: aldo/keto reductase [Acidipila sp.]|nr:aldo/keto reductase [Acidipila sp.]
MPELATAEGTRRFASRFSGRAATGYFRERRGLQFSSLGLGSYLGTPDVATDNAYTDAVVAAVLAGINVIDSAINYRFQRSERSIGEALRRLQEQGVERRELVLCTKAGYLTPDGEMPPDPGEYFANEYLEPGILRAEEIAAGCHCLAPQFLEDQLERSLRNLGVDSVDIFYLHNPETQLPAVSREDFRARLRGAFALLETAVTTGKIGAYGLATWSAFRQAPEAADFISIEEMAGLAREVAGENHHFQFVQVPFNLVMAEALLQPNQAIEGRMVPLVSAAHRLGITVVGSAALLQGRLARSLPPFLKEVVGLESDLLRALQFARSAPGITTALVGMSSVAHVHENLKLLEIEPMPETKFRELFHRQGSA